MIVRSMVLGLLAMGGFSLSQDAALAQGLVKIDSQKSTGGKPGKWKNAESDEVIVEEEDKGGKSGKRKHPEQDIEDSADKTAGYDDREAAAVNTFVQGNLLFTLYHEAGHALVSLFDLPVLAREEDAVDNLATLMMLPEKDGSEQDEALLLSAMDGWFISDETAAQREEERAFWDEHGLDAQRGYQIACLVIGSDPEYFAELAANLEIPEERVDSCVDEMAKIAVSWHAVLSKHMLGDQERPKAKAKVSYGPAKGDYARWPEILRKWGTAEMVAADMTESFRLPYDITIAYTQCDESNAWWSSDERRLTVCYELLQDFVDMAE